MLKNAQQLHQLGFRLLNNLSKSKPSVPLPKCPQFLQPPARLLKTGANKHKTGLRSPLYEKIRDSVLVLEARQGPLGKTVVGVGQGVFTAGVVFTSGALVYYVYDLVWKKDFDPNSKVTQMLPEVRERVNTAYMYMANSIGVSMLGAIASFRLFGNPAFLNMVSGNPLTAIGLTMGSQFLITILVRSLPYREGFGLKQAGSVAQAGLIGLAAAPMYLLGAQSIIRAGFVTAGVIGGLAGVSSIVPHDTFVTWEAPLRVGMYAVFLSFLSLWFVKRHHPSYNLLYKVAMHGGLVVFPAYYLHNSKALVHSAITDGHFDPINSSMPLYTDVLNIYGRLAFLLPPHYFISGDTRKITWAARTKEK